MDICSNKNIKQWSEGLEQFNEVVILGKGPSIDLYVESNHKNAFIIGINQAVNIHKCSMLVANDVESYKAINSNTYENLEYILCPVYPHVGGKPKERFDKSVLKNIGTFNKQFIPFNLKTSKNIEEEYISLGSRLTSSNNAADFISKYMFNVQQIFLYGIGMKNSNSYANCFNEEGKGDQYNNQFLQRIRKNIENTFQRKDTKLFFN